MKRHIPKKGPLRATTLKRDGSKAAEEVVSRILNTESGARWYSNGPPIWKQGKGGRCKTAEEAEKERLQQIKVLRRHGNEDPNALQLAEKLRDCCPLNRCLSGACPECQRAFQRWFVSAANNFLKSDGRDFAVASIVPRQPTFREGDLM